MKDEMAVGLCTQDGMIGAGFQKNHTGFRIEHRLLEAMVEAESPIGDH